MTDRYVKATGSNTSPYETWAKAATSLQTAIGAVAAGEKIYVDSAFSENLASDTTYNPASNFIEVISTSDTATEPPTTYAAGATANGNANGVDLAVSRGGWFGYSFLTGSGGTASSVALTNSGGDVVHLEDCTVNVRSTNAGGGVITGIGVAGGCILTTKNCTWIFGAVGQGFNVRSVIWTDERSTFAPSGSIPTAVFENVDRGAIMRFNGSDFSTCSGNLYAAGVGVGFLRLDECTLHASTATPTPSSDGFELLMNDCASGDTHYKIKHVTYRGSTVDETTIKMNTSEAAKYDGTNAYSWLVTTTANVSFAMPYHTPWIDAYHSGTSAITPRLEIMRNDSTSAYTDGQVWPEVLAKATSGSVRTSIATGRRGPLATAASVADGAGLGSWDGEGGSAKSMKLVPSSSLTPAEIGPVRMRVCAGGASMSFYVNPKMLDLGQTEANVERAFGASIVNTNVTTGGGSGGGPLIGGRLIQ